MKGGSSFLQRSSAGVLKKTEGPEGLAGVLGWRIFIEGQWTVVFGYKSRVASPKETDFAPGVLLRISWNDSSLIYSVLSIRSGDEKLSGVLDGRGGGGGGGDDCSVCPVEESLWDWRMELSGHETDEGERDKD